MNNEYCENNQPESSHFLKPWKYSETLGFIKIQNLATTAM